MDFLIGVKRSKCGFRVVPFFLLVSAPTALLWVVSWNISRELPETQREVERNCGESPYHKESMATWPCSNIKLGDWVRIKSQILMQPNGSGYFSVAVNNFAWASWVTHHRYLFHCYSSLNCRKSWVSSLREAHCHVCFACHVHVLFRLKGIARIIMKTRWREMIVLSSNPLLLEGRRAQVLSWSHPCSL